jgi:hypothetical protein
LDKTTAPQSSVVLKREELSAKIDGVRVILIGAGRTRSVCFRVRDFLHLSGLYLLAIPHLGGLVDNLSQGVGNLDKTTAPQSSVVLKREELSAKIDGVRVGRQLFTFKDNRTLWRSCLIQVPNSLTQTTGSLSNLPLLDWSVKKFNVDVRDWSSTVNADTNFETFLNSSRLRTTELCGAVVLSKFPTP